MMATRRYPKIELPKSLQSLICEHPTPINVTTLGERPSHYRCPGCDAEWTTDRERRRP